MYIIDTNILISELLFKYEQDDLTAKYRAFYQKIPLLKRVIPDFVFSEFELYMAQVVPSRYKNQMTKEEIKEIKAVTSIYLEKLIEKSSLIFPSTSVFKIAFDFYKRFLNTHYISFTDSLLLALAKENDYILVSKDQRLNQRAKELKIAYFEG